MHHLIEVTNTGEMLRTARKCNGEPLVVGVGGFQRAIVKFDLVSVCEVFGYLLASATGTRVPRMQGFWTRDALDADTVKSKPGRAGILVEFHEDWMPVRRCQVARLDPAMFAQASALCVFDRHEWGEFGVSRGQVYFVDLERLFPPIRPEELFSASGQQRMELLSEWEQLFLDVTSNSLEKVLLDAAGHQLESEVRQAIQRLCGLEDRSKRSCSPSDHPARWAITRDYMVVLQV